MDFPTDDFKLELCDRCAVLLALMLLRDVAERRVGAETAETRYKKALEQFNLMFPLTEPTNEQ
jgi:hypothetical protein